LAPDHAGQLSYAEAVRRGMAARAQRQRDLMREHPELGAFAVMAMACNEHADDRDRAGGTLTNSSPSPAAGHFGVMHRYNNAPPRKG
jgi:2-oxo-4-hydroxy-4-carboxy--5-ureidoimidazoline (OHCU) decarboxylase